VEEKKKALRKNYVRRIEERARPGEEERREERRDNIYRLKFQINSNNTQSHTRRKQ
jgi:hypothetical protein